ncbi:putative aldehyde dehydrogenase family protein [Coleophoma cylindrospora]|uniref:aldehyde dehydrogenase (NAD(+)) n=1 Tax=Coleophoma cylindrospora TaxID=1849047 RepID=A0A3D8QPD2_9HELO|nr:putative aldehyde dehydrogenase family protein [Coleophoma cylindrospora]
MTDLPHVANWVDGAYTRASPASIAVVNPATELPVATIDATPRDVVDAIVTRSQQQFASGAWSHAEASDRFAVLVKAAALLRSNLAEFVELEVRQTGRPVREMQTQLARVPEWLEYFAGLARVHEGAVTPFKGPVVNTLTRLPIGVVAQITPWNHPLLIATKKIGAALAAGNTVIVKPSELAPLSVLKLGELFQTAGLPDGTLQIICGYGRDTGKFLCENAHLARIDLTGGLATYRAIAPVAAYNMIPMTAELGGKAPVCIFPSMGSDMEQAVKAALFASFIASGQTCVTGSRLLVHADIYDEFVALLLLRTKALRVGDPTDPETQIGAVINQASVERCSAFVSRAVEDGGKILCGGKPSERKGFFFEPTLIETHSKSDLSCNEVFGPVIAILKCTSEEDIIAVANGTDFALGASVWTRDFTQAHRVAEKIDAGVVWVNGHHLNDPSSPWGGFRQSGIGKENGREAYESYTKVKSTVLNYGVSPAWFDDKAENARYG